MRLLSFPFRFNPGQPESFVTYEYESNEYKAQQIEAFMKTHKGQRPIYADFGINDPTFSGGKALTDFDDTTFVSEFATFYGNIVLEKVTIIGSEGALSKIDVEFT
jgi:hypothetical protein